MNKEETLTRVIGDLTVVPELEELAPKMTDDSYRNLKRDISVNGLSVPIKIAVLHDVDYKECIVDGFNRYRALTELKQINTIKACTYPSVISEVGQCEAGIDSGGTGDIL